MHRISAKNLGQLALEDSCPRCFWLKARLGWKTPYSIFPGVFSSIDSFSKRAILAHFAQNGHLPPWLAGRWSEARPLPTPHHSRFWIKDAETGIVLSGVPDLLLGLPRNRIAILDLKTARFSNHQDSLLPMYKTQLVGYSLIAESIGLGQVTNLGLVYTEPPECEDNDGLDSLVNNDGFSMPFKATTVPIELDRGIIPPLLRRAKELMDLEEAPTGLEGCMECRLVHLMAGLIEHRVISYPT